MLSRLNIGKRLALAFGTQVLMSLGLVAVAAFGLTIATQSLDGIINRLIPASAVTSRAKADLALSKAAHNGLAAAFGDAAATKQAKAEWDAAQQRLDKAMADYVAFATTPETQGNLGKFRGYMADYRNAVKPVAEKLETGAFGTAADAAQAMQAARKGYEPAYEMLATIEDKMIERGNEVFAKVQSTIRAIFVALLVLCAVCTGLAVALGWRITRSVLHPVREATAFADRMAAGDLSRAPRAHGSDEIAHMVQVLARMQQSLAGIVGQVRQSAESIQVASAEVATGNADLSGRTETMASNLQQTAASMEQIHGTVKQTADSAQTANQLAASAAEVAQRGGAVVAQVIETMDEINGRSKRIADIIGTIDGIAFQTNILALNAAVEAARAGEQGRGFAVVAGEVRNLAQRSAEAAREIKSLIGASVDKVEDGARLVKDAGHTMEEIVSSVQRVTDIIGEITAAAVEQSSGIGQVNSAVTQLDQVTQQNAALVEESAAAAESLKDQAQRLAGVVSTFRLEAQATTA
jgi:methyl-accepting chemotaxis protein